MSLVSLENAGDVTYNQPAKRIRSTAVQGRHLKISDLKTECLKSVLEYLDFSDLMNAAEANDRLKEVACTVFGEKYRSQAFAINATKIGIHGESMPSISTKESPLETIGKFSKFFGPSITKLAIFGSTDEFYMQWVESCVSKYYSETLVELLFYNYVHGNMMSELRKSFPFVESVTIIQSRISLNISQFNKWFPQMRSLKLIDNMVCDARCIETHFPELETLVIWLHGSTKNGFTKSNLSEAIRLNPNIKDLWFQFYSFPVSSDELQVDQDLCRSVAINARKLERFVWAPDNNSLPNCDRIAFKTIKYFVTEAPVLQFSFKHLEEMEIRRIRVPINDMFDFICRNKKLIKLKITLDYMNLRPAASEQAQKMLKNLPKLSELIVDWRIFSTDDIMKLITGCKSLTKLQLLNISDRISQFAHQIAQRNIDYNWKVLRTESDFIFKRKI